MPARRDDASSLSPAEFRKFFADKTEKWAKVIRTAHIKFGQSPMGEKRRARQSRPLRFPSRPFPELHRHKFPDPINRSGRLVRGGGWHFFGDVFSKIPHPSGGVAVCSLTWSWRQRAHAQAGRSGCLTHSGRIDSALSTVPDVAHAGRAQAGRPGVAIPAPGRPETSAFPDVAQHHEPDWS